MGVDVGTQDREAGEYVTSVMKYEIFFSLILALAANFFNAVHGFQNVRHPTFKTPTNMVSPRNGIPIHEIR